MAQLQAYVLSHNAPAGSQYRSLLEAGRTTLELSYPGFLEGKCHALLPPILKNSLPEEIGLDSRIASNPYQLYDTKQKRQLEGHSKRKMGEDLEVLVFQRFEQVLQPSQFLWKGFTVSKEKMYILERDHPDLKDKIQNFREKYDLNSNTASIYGEADMMVYVKDVGLVLIEVKCSAKELNKGVEQCHKMGDFCSIVFDSSVSGTVLPMIKVVIIGDSSIDSADDASAPPCHKDHDRNVWILSTEVLCSVDAFRVCWEQILLELQQSSQPHNNIRQFEDFVSEMVGLWCMVSLRGTGISCKGKENEFS